MERIYQKISEIEEQTATELVVVRNGQSDRYADMELLAGALMAFVVFTVQMFVDIDIDPYTIYIVTILAFAVGYFPVRLIRPLKSALIPKARKDKSVEIYGRALFQKGGIHLTQKHIGILVYCSDLERTATVIADNGIETKVPQEDMQKVREALKRVYRDGNFVANISEALGTLCSVLHTYLPSSGKGINEIPDDLKIVL